MKTVKEQIAVMQACEEGRTIEFRRFGESWKPIIGIPVWDWSTKDYRVKPEPEYEPYTDANDILFDSKVHGPYVMYKDKSSCRSLLIIENMISQVWGDAANSNKSLLEQICWQDGHPFGKLKE